MDDDELVDSSAVRRGSHRRARRAEMIISAAGIAVVVVAAIIWLPRVLVHVDMAGRSGPGLDDEQFVTAVNDARTTLTQSVAGLLVLVTAIAAWRQYVLARQAQLTDRYVRAVQLLSSDTVEGRTGGVYALERLAQDSRLDESVVVEVLAVFVRARAAAAPRLPAWQPHRSYYDAVGYFVTRAPDVQACLTVIGRFGYAWNLEDLRTGRSIHPLALVQVDLRRAYLVDAYLDGVSLDESHLEIAQLSRARLRGAQLRSAYLDGAILQGADLRNAMLDGASLRSVEVDEHTRLEGASLRYADLSEIDNLSAAALTGAVYDDETTWPAGYDPVSAGAVCVSDGS